jgi:Uma2 family endonuclease
VADRSLEAYAEPGPNGYAAKSVHRGDDRLAIPGFPELTLSVNEVFG